VLGKRESGERMAQEMTVYTVKQVAKILKVEVHFVYGLVRDGTLQSKKLGKQMIRITGDALQDYLRNTGAAKTAAVVVPNDGTEGSTR